MCAFYLGLFTEGETMVALTANMVNLCFDQLRSIVQTVCLSSSWVSCRQ